MRPGEEIEPIEYALWQLELAADELIKLGARSALMDLIAEIIKRHRLDSFKARAA
jgi:hypothetical protein